MSENMTDVFGYGRSPISRSQRMAWIRQLRHQTSPVLQAPSFHYSKQASELSKLVFQT